MASEEPYALVYAPSVEPQIERALNWWPEHREKAPELLAREFERALDLIAAAPSLGQRARTRRYGRLYRVLLPKTAYHLYYRVIGEEHLVQIVLFRHARRRPLK